MIYLTTHTNLYSFSTVWGITENNHIAIISKLSVFLSGTMLWGLLEYSFSQLEIDFHLGEFLWGGSYRRAILGENSRNLQYGDQIKHDKSPGLFMAEKVNPGTSQSNTESPSEFINSAAIYGWNDKVFNVPKNNLDTYYSFKEIKDAYNQRQYNLRHELYVSGEMSNLSKMYRVITDTTSSTNRTKFSYDTVEIINLRYITRDKR